MMKIICTVVLSLLAFSLSAKEKPVKHALFIIPGALVEPVAYEGLTGEIVDRLEADISVRYAEFFGNFPNLKSSAAQIELFFRDIQAKGFQPSITVIGHSLGGLGIGDLPNEYYENIVLMASYVQADWLKYSDLLTNKPVLSIGGSLDTQTLTQRIAFDAFRFRKKPNFYPVILDGVSHFQFADGHRLDATYPQGTADSEARALIADVISTFIQGDLDSLDAKPYIQASKKAPRCIFIFL